MRAAWKQLYWPLRIEVSASCTQASFSALFGWFRRVIEGVSVDVSVRLSAVQIKITGCRESRDVPPRT